MAVVHCLTQIQLNPKRSVLEGGDYGEGHPWKVVKDKGEKSSFGSDCTQIREFSWSGVCCSLFGYVSALRGSKLKLKLLHKLLKLD